MIDDYSISCFESSTAGTGRNDLACRLMPCDYALITFRAFAQVLVIDCADIRSADGRSLDGEENFAMARFWDRNFSHFHGAVPRKERRFHHLSHRNPLSAFGCTGALGEQRMRLKHPFIPSSCTITGCAAMRG